MYSSTAEYLHALRSGDYLRCLEWIDFLCVRYSLQETKIDADSVLLIAIYELIQQDFEINDGKKIATLMRIMEEKSTLFQGKEGLAVTVWYGALAQCLVYRSFNLMAFYQQENPRLAQDVLDFMNRPSPTWDEECNSKALKEQIIFLNHLVSTVSEDVLERARAQIYPALAYRNCAQEYAELLAKISTPEPHNELHAIRHGLAMSIATCVKEVDFDLQQVKHLIEKIKQLSPEPWEEKYFVQLSPPSSTKEKIAHSMSKVSFFLKGVMLQVVPEASGNPEKKIT